MREINWRKVGDLRAGELLALQPLSCYRHGKTTSGKLYLEAVGQLVTLNAYDMPGAFVHSLPEMRTPHICGSQTMVVRLERGVLHTYHFTRRLPHTEYSHWKHTAQPILQGRLVDCVIHDSRLPGLENWAYDR